MVLFWLTQYKYGSYVEFYGNKNVENFETKVQFRWLRFVKYTINNSE